MITAISGTPGTGKTSVAKILAKKLDANLISISMLVREVKHSWDKSRRTRIVDIKDLQKAVNKKLIRGKFNIVEGHLSHLLNSDIVVVLRCNPKELERRMKKKKWSRKKIGENIEAEILDEIITEAIEKHGMRKVFELDTSNKTAKGTAAIIKRLLNNFGTKNYQPGIIDWTERYKDYLLRQ